jgi:hypothetical protein
MRRTTRYGRVGWEGSTFACKYSRASSATNCSREQPIDLTPRGGDLGGDGVAQHLTDRGEQVLPNDRVLLRADPQGDVLIGDSAHDVVE